MKRVSSIIILLVTGLLLSGCGDQTPSEQANGPVGPAGVKTAVSPADKAPPAKRPAVTFEGAFEDPFERIRIEAEDGKVVQEGKMFRLVADPKASGGKCIGLPDKCGKPGPGKYARVTYEFDVKKAGFYTFWCRRWWKDGCGDTLAVRFDKVGKPHKTADLFGSDDSSKPPKWNWSPVRLKNAKNPRQQYYLTEGKHTMEILNREDGPRYDVILLTEDPDYNPVGLDE